MWFDNVNLHANKQKLYRKWTKSSIIYDPNSHNNNTDDAHVLSVCLTFLLEFNGVIIIIIWWSIIGVEREKNHQNKMNYHFLDSRFKNSDFQNFFRTFSSSNPIEKTWQNYMGKKTTKTSIFHRISIPFSKFLVRFWSIGIQMCFNIYNNNGTL